MKRPRDAWYLRLPNGQEIKAKSTAAVLYHIQQGTIPKNSWARRSRAEEWLKLEWHAEFTEAVTGIKPARETEASESSPTPAFVTSGAASVAARLDPMQLRTVGVQGILEDLLASIDTAFRRSKLLIAFLGAALIGLAVGGIPYAADKLAQSQSPANQPPAHPGLIHLIATLAAAAIFAVTNALLTKITYLELSTSRLVSFREATQGIVRSAVKLLVVTIALVGGAFYLMSLLHRLPEWVTVPPHQIAQADLGTRILGGAASIFSLLCEVFLWIALVLTGLLPSILVGEDSSLVGGVFEWLRLVRAYFGRIALAEVLTLGTGVLLAAPVYIPIQRALVHYASYLPHPVEMVALATSGTAFLLVVAVSNVFIFLDAKYEQSEP
jgi:hypothetical protein